MANNASSSFDVIVIGGGHAGVEAAYAAAQMGSQTLLITLELSKISLMPCNPAIGGVGKGHIVYEISALGGLMPKLCTQTYLQARMLNTKKGPAVQGLRLQIDKHAYNTLSHQTLANTPNLTLFEGVVDDILLNNKQQISGVVTLCGTTFSSKTVVITTGTFLNGKIHIGTQNYAAGRRDEQAVTGISRFFKTHNIQLGRLKTGTPPRLLRSSLDFDKMEFQEPDNLEYLFEFTPHKTFSKRPCYITHTNKQTHEIIKNNLHLSAMYNGNIKGVGPRYCPSIEDKIGRFPDKESHHVFVEPEDASYDEVYPSGLSTSLPLEVQRAYINSIAGFENAVIVKAGYAVEYDCVWPNQLKHTLELKTIPGIFLAGQINGTTGYEEAAGQGIVAGINAHLQAHNLPEFVLDRNESYIGVMIDDLVTFSVDEPYRMFTSRAERRLLLRQDNVFLRLADKAYNLGLINQELYYLFCKERELITDTLNSLRTGKNNNELLKLFGQPECDISLIQKQNTSLSSRAAHTIHAELLYAPYIAREQQDIERTTNYQGLVVPAHFDFTNLPGLSKELQQKLIKHKPNTIGQASLIPGMTPAALSLIIFTIRRHKKIESETL